MAGLGRLLAGGFGTTGAGARVRVLDREIGRPGRDAVLEQYVLHVNTLTPTPATVELFYNGGALLVEQTTLAAPAAYLSLPFYRVGGLGRLEVYVTMAGGPFVVSCNVTGKYVYTRPAPLAS